MKIFSSDSNNKKKDVMKNQLTITEKTSKGKKAAIATGAVVVLAATSAAISTVADASTAKTDANVKNFMNKASKL